MKKNFSLILLALALTACSRPPATTPAPALPSPMANTPAPIYTLPPTRGPGTPIAIPTPDAPRPLPTIAAERWHVVQAGETLQSIAWAYGLPAETLAAANQIQNPNLLAVGQTLRIPALPLRGEAPSLKLIPDSELVNGPYARTLDLHAFIQSWDGYLAHHSETVGDEILTGEQILLRVAQDYSVNPRLLLALLEYRSGWLTQRNPANTLLPLGFNDGWHTSLYRQLTWAANELNRGYYLWKAGGVPAWTLADGSLVRANPQVNAGTAGLHHLFARLDTWEQWQVDVGLSGFLATYVRLFGYPFDWSIEPLIPSDLTQPPLTLPFAAGETWYFTGGPHGGWDSGSAWAALDFAPPDAEGCNQSAYLVRAAAAGRIVRSDHGAVVQDLDGDSYAETGWTLLYMHIAPEERVPVGAWLEPGDPIGYPSCKGGVANGTHVHLARRYNGEWIPADGDLPFNLDGWITSGNGVEYDGFLTRDGQQVEAWDARRPENQISR